MRIRCNLFGCLCDDAPVCMRCGTELYDGEFYQTGRLDWLVLLWGRVSSMAWRIFCPPRCEVCGRKLRHHEGLFVCSRQECLDAWEPF